jgi:hypothetical protein
MADETADAAIAPATPNLSDNQVALLKAVAKAVKGAFDQIPESVPVEEFESAFVNELAALSETPKLTPVELFEAGLDVANAIAVEIGNTTVTAIVSDVRNTSEDAIAGKVIATIADAFKLYKDIKAAAKA